MGGEVKVAQSFTIRIWIAGDYADAVRAVKEFCAEGACFTVSPVEYVYTGGSESGVCVTRINYPRFPDEPEVIREQVFRLANHLKARLFQDSYSVEVPDMTTWVSSREN